MSVRLHTHTNTDTKSKHFAPNIDYRCCCGTAAAIILPGCALLLSGFLSSSHSELLLLLLSLSVDLVEKKQILLLFLPSIRWQKSRAHTSKLQHTHADRLGARSRPLANFVLAPRALMATGNGSIGAVGAVGARAHFSVYFFCDSRRWWSARRPLLLSLSLFLVDASLERTSRISPARTKRGEMHELLLLACLLTYFSPLQLTWRLAGWLIAGGNNVQRCPFWSVSKQASERARRAPSIMMISSPSSSSSSSSSHLSTLASPSRRRHPSFSLLAPLDRSSGARRRLWSERRTLAARPSINSRSSVCAAAAGGRSDYV